MITDLKPYEEYKESGLPWLGQVPEHWEVKRAKSIFVCIDNRSMTGKEELLTVSSTRGVIPRNSAKVTMFKAESYVGYKLCWPGDLVINSLWAWAGGLGVSQYHGIVSSAYGVYRTRSNAVMLSAFVHLVVRSTPFNWELKVRSKGIWTSRLQLTDYSFLDAPFPVPPPAEQAAIVRFLNWANGRLDRAILAKRKIIKLLEEQKQVIIHRAVTRGLDPNVMLKPSGVEGLGNIPAHWKITKLKFAASVQTGITLGKQYNKVQLSERPYLRVANVQSGRLDLRRIKSVYVPDSEARSCELINGDVLMTEGGDIDKLGRGCLWRGEIQNCIHQNHIFAVRTNAAKLIPKFLAALTFSGHGRRYFQTTAKQTTNLASTNSTTVRDFPLVMPPIDEQGLILEYIDKKSTGLNSAISRLEREIDLLREYRTRLIADVVTGKLDVREAAAMLPDEIISDPDAKVCDDELIDEEEDVTALENEN